MEIRDAFGRTKVEQDRVGSALLIRAFDVLLRLGWLHPRLCEPWIRASEGGTAVTIREAVWEAHDPRESEIETVYALRLLEKIEHWHHQWEGHPRRAAVDVMRLLQAAIALGGEDPPKLPRTFGQARKRGGWKISHGSKAVH